jgi:hypothetical protein
LKTKLFVDLRLIGFRVFYAVPCPANSLLRFISIAFESQ